MLALLEKRYKGDSGNGPAWAFVPMVRNAAGFNATRTMDALAMSLWPSRGLELHGHEIKVSRADWLRELKDPSKAEVFARLVDRWWLVVSDASIVKAGELPPTWGLMVATGRGLVVRVQAPALESTGASTSRTFLAALLRAAVRTAEVTPSEVSVAVAAARDDERARNADNVERWRVERDDLRDRIRAFEQASGVHLGGESWRGAHSPKVVGAALRSILDGDANTERFIRRLETLADQADRIAADLRVAAGSSETTLIGLSA